MLFSNSVQEAMDLALIAQASTLQSRLPFLHIFDGFRTSHELMQDRELSDEDIRAMIDDDLVRAHRARALSPDHPVIRGTTQNPDVFFQARETVNPYYRARAGRSSRRRWTGSQGSTGRHYRLFEYLGAPDALRVIVADGLRRPSRRRGGQRLDLPWREGRRARRFGYIRPSQRTAFLEALPETVRAIAVLDRTKEPGSARRAAVPGCRHGRCVESRGRKHRRLNGFRGS